MKIAEQHTQAPPAAPPRAGARTAAMLVIGALAFTAYLLAGQRSAGEPQTTDAPRENVSYVLTERFARGEGFSYPLRHHAALPTDVARALTPRDAAAVDGEAVSQDFAGTIALFAALLWLWKPLALAAVPLLAVLSAFLLTQLVADLFDGAPDRRASWRRPRTRAEAWTGFAAFALWLAHPGLIVNAASLMDPAMPSLVAVLLSLVFFVRYWRAGRSVDLVWLALSFGAAVLVRYPNILFGIPLALALLLGRRISLRHGALAACLLAPVPAAVMAFNRAAYGSATVTGYHIANRLLRESVNFEGGAFFRVHLDAVRNHVVFYGVEYPTVLGFAAIGVAAALVSVRRDRRALAVMATVAAAIGAYAAYHVGLDTWGSWTPAINASFVRYTLPALAVGTGLLAFAFRAVRGRRAWVIGALAVVLLGGSVATGVAGPVAGSYRWRAVEQHRDLRRIVVERTPPDALVAVRVSDRAIWPARQTLTLTYLVRHERPVRKTSTRSVWTVLPRPERFADVADTIIEAGIPLYLLHDFQGPPLHDYRAALRARGLDIRSTGPMPDPLPSLFEVLRVTG